MSYWRAPLFALLLCPSTVFSNDQPWVYVIVTSSEKGWIVSQQGNADVSVSGKRLLINLHDPKNPSAISDTVKGKIEGANITDALQTSHLTAEGGFTEYRFPYTGSTNKIGYQSSVGERDPGGRETIILRSNIAFIGLTREISGDNASPDKSLRPTANNAADVPGR